MNTLITSTVGRSSHIARKARLSVDLAVRMEENNRRYAAKVAAAIAEKKSKGEIWYNTPRITRA